MLQLRLGFVMCVKSVTVAVGVCDVLWEGRVQDVVHGVELDHAAVPGASVKNKPANSCGRHRLHFHHLVLRQVRVLLRRNNLSVLIHDPATQHGDLGSWQL